MKRDELTAKQVGDVITTEVWTAQYLRRYAELNALQGIKTAALQREQNRPGSCLPAQKVQDRILYNQQLNKALAELLINADAGSWPVSTEIWVIHGRVLNQSRQGQAGMTVQLLNHPLATSAFNNTAYSAKTEANGHFTIVDNSPPLQCDPPTTCFGLNVLDATNKQVYQDTCLFKFRGGMVDYREIVLS